MTALVIGNHSRNLVIFRGAILRELVARGVRTVAIGPEPDVWVAARLAEMGVSFVCIPLARASINAFSDVIFLLRLSLAFLRFRPDVVISFTHKPNIFSSLLYRCCGVGSHVMIVEGLGYAFIEKGDLRRQFARHVIATTYKLVAKSSSGGIFINAADHRHFLANGYLSAKFPVLITGGIGVNLLRFVPTKPPLQTFTFLMVARLLRSKGVVEFCAAAREVRRCRPGARFVIVGAFDPGTDGISRAVFENYVADQTISYVGEVNDVQPHYRECSVFVLPSYREGFPVTIMEAMACGRAVIATDVTGCRDAVVDGVTGVLVAAQQVAPLTQAMVNMFDHPEQVVRFGINGRKRAEANFDEKAIAAAQVGWVAGFHRDAAII